ncbi:MAG: hypothetical protein AABZ67_15725 [Pseudomonadota bacterium]
MNSDEEDLLGHYRRLIAEQRRMLLEFAVFLAERNAGTEVREASAQPPLPIARPATETVVMAIKRLTQTYPMLDRRQLFSDTSRHVAQHALEGRPAAEVIDELEAVFARHYETMRNEE